MLRRAKIVATLGPSSHTSEKIDALFQAGADAFRLNFSHSIDHEPSVKIIRNLEVKYQRPTTIIADLQGPKWRIGKIDSGHIHLNEGEILVFDQDPNPGNHLRIPFLHPELYSVLSAGDAIRLDDGRIHLSLQESHPDKWVVRVERGGVLSSHKGVNIPYVEIPTSSLTKKDYDDLERALTWGVDWVALSFVQKPQDVLDARSFIQKKGCNFYPRLMAKLEKPMALECLNDIVDVADGVMVARGDLGVELPLEEVPPIQRHIITSCRKAGKPVVVATQMLESMIQAPSPTRAEVSDVANAVYEGADAVMLSGESAVGKYPVEAVQMMSRIILTVEKDNAYRNMMKNSGFLPQPSRSDALTAAAKNVAATIPVAALFSCTLTGETPIRTARERPESPIIALTPSLEVARQLGLVWGVEAFWTKHTQDLSDMTGFVCSLASQKALAKPGAFIAILSGMPLWKTGGTNILRVEVVSGDASVNVEDYLEQYV